MSSALNRAIYARLAGTEVLTGRFADAQATLATLLAVDPDTNPSRPLVVKGNLQGVTAYPCITFHESAGTIDRRFTRGDGAVGGMAVENPVYDFEVWGKSSSGVELSDIDDVMNALLDRRFGAPKLPLADGEMRMSETFVMPAAQYDDKRNAWFLLRRIQFHIEWYS